jgi:hypothetical protein
VKLRGVPDDWPVFSDRLRIKYDSQRTKNRADIGA